jgi:hypothetical protein
VPWLPTLTLVGMGGVAGLAVGYLAHPPRQPRGLAVAVAAGFGLVGFAVIVLLVRLRLPAGASSSLTWLLGAVVVVVVQSAVVGLLWRRRAAAPA